MMVFEMQQLILNNNQVVFISEYIHHNFTYFWAYYVDTCVCRIFSRMHFMIYFVDDFPSLEKLHSHNLSDIYGLWNVIRMTCVNTCIEQH